MGCGAKIRLGARRFFGKLGKIAVPVDDAETRKVLVQPRFGKRVIDDLSLAWRTSLIGDDPRAVAEPRISRPARSSATSRKIGLCERRSYGTMIALTSP